MGTNLSRFKTDLERLVSRGELLEIALQYEIFPDSISKQVKEQLGKKAPEYLKSLPKFGSDYQAWYSEALALVRQVLPDRLSDFVRHYEKPKGRKLIDFENYRIEDCLQGLTITRGYYKEKVVSKEGACPHLQQQIAIVKAAVSRFESSLFDIRQLVQADLLESELDAARELAKHKFFRAAGALAGVVLERHLQQVCTDHQVKVVKKNPAISDLSEALKAASVIGIPEWRYLQHLADIRNLCDHNKAVEPTAEQVADLIGGVEKVTKTIL